MKLDYEREKYLTTSSHIKNTIEKYGVAIIEDVLDKDEIINMRRGVWDYYEHISQKFKTPISRKDEKTWKGVYELFPKHSMLQQHFGIGHSQYVWDLRQNPKIVNIFKEIWDEEELITSFDGASLHLPPEITGRGWFRNLWLHCDQSFKRNDFECIQSWVTAYDIEEGDATLCFLEGSNKFHKEFSENFDMKDSGEWNKLEEEHIDFYKERNCKVKQISCKAGSMVFWDSRTIHCGIEPVKGRKNMKFRNVVYICMTPKKLAKESILKKREKAFKELRMTTHLPHKSLLFSKLPRTYGNQLPEVVDIQEPVLTDLGKSLIS